MTSFKEIKGRSEQIDFLVRFKYPLYRSIEAASIGNRPTALSSDPNQYLSDAKAYRESLEAIATSDQNKISALVADAQLALQGPLLTLNESADFIAQILYADDGYPDFTIPQRLKCAQEYKERLRVYVLSGTILFINPHTKKPFDHTRLSAEHMPNDGLIPTNRLHDCLRPNDAGHAHKFPKLPPKISNAPPPIEPIGMDRSYLIHSRPPEGAEKPDWNKWNLIDKAPLWKVACLAIDVEPPKAGSEDLWYEAQLKDLPAKFHAMWEIVNGDNHLSRLEAVHISGRMLYPVDIGWFSAWAMAKGLDIPERLKDRATRFKAGQEQAVAATTKARQLPAADSKPASSVDSDDDEEGEKGEDGGYPWAPTAWAIGKEILPKYSKHNILKIAEAVREEMIVRKDSGKPGVYTGRGKKVPDAETIKRHALTGLKG